MVPGHAGRDIQIQVADEGTGIPESDLIRIFDPFYTTKPVGKGTGLGLSICYGIIKQLGGDIEVKSAIGEGARFIIRIPLDGEEKKKVSNLSQ
jgi:two-component system NtrC family sensor kinase